MAGHLDRVAKMHSCVDTNSPNSTHLPQFHSGTKSVSEKSILKKAGVIKSDGNVDTDLRKSRDKSAIVNLPKAASSKNNVKQPRFLEKLQSTSVNKDSGSQSLRNLSCDRIYEDALNLNHRTYSGKGLQQKRAQLRIWEENQMILKRLHATKSTLDSKKWEEDEQRNKKWLGTQEKRRRALQQELDKAQSDPYSLLRSRKAPKSKHAPIAASMCSPTSFDRRPGGGSVRAEHLFQPELGIHDYCNDQLVICTQHQSENERISSTSLCDFLEQEVQAVLAVEGTLLSPDQADESCYDLSLNEARQNNLQPCGSHNHLLSDVRAELDCGILEAQEATAALSTKFDDNNCLDDNARIQYNQTLSEAMLKSIPSPRDFQDEDHSGEISGSPTLDSSRSNADASTFSSVFLHNEALNEHIAHANESHSEYQDQNGATNDILTDLSTSNSVDVGTRTLVNESSTFGFLGHEALSGVLPDASLPIGSENQEYHDRDAESYQQDEESYHQDEETYLQDEPSDHYDEESQYHDDDFE
uniref:AlNc14C13G1538 protein n=1 Tax=Albugo laibachii Nc14 TaxID=890382 RepID=F0W3H5_9STRA|nr:AlNc14C13G1538 [Albugo laibachii Nc14]CCA16323.1 AlNc14C20G2098 [Albugo laibachii Nc14]|eukprot:CCA16323.1 AlNc14C20G2098 [Albugo laibachii Nc14]